MIRTDVQQSGDGLAGGGDGLGLQILPQPVQQEHHDALGNLPDNHRADAGNGHEKTLAEDLAAADVVDRLEDDLRRGHQKCRVEDDGTPHGGRRIEASQQQSGNQQHSPGTQGDQLLPGLPRVLLVVVVVSAAAPALVAVVMMVIMSAGAPAMALMFMLVIMVMIVVIVPAAALGGLLFCLHSYPSISSITWSKAMAKICPMWASSKE